jgi:5-methylcytosine-specific restriction protein A
MPHDLSTTPRRAMSATRQLRIFERHKGACYLCGGRIAAGEAWDVEHIRALALGGPDTDDNCAPAHRRCHAVKTRDDTARISKAKRQKAASLGIKTRKGRPMPGSRASGIKKHMDGSVSRREPVALWHPGHLGSGSKLDVEGSD